MRNTLAAWDEFRLILVLPLKGYAYRWTNYRITVNTRFKIAIKLEPSSNKNTVYEYT